MAAKAKKKTARHYDIRVTVTARHAQQFVQSTEQQLLHVEIADEAIGDVLNGVLVRCVEAYREGQDDS